MIARALRVTVVAASLLASLAVAGAEEPSLEVRIEPQRFGVEDHARLVVTVTEAGGVRPPELAGLENLEVVAGPNTEQQFNWVNGVSSYSLRFVWIVRARETGTARVGPLAVEVDGRTLTSERAAAEVVEGSLRALPRGRRAPFDPFADRLGVRDAPTPRIDLRLLVSEREVVLGEPVTVSVVLDTTAVVERFDWTTPPAFPGWWAQPVALPDPITPEMVEVAGVRMQRFPVHRAVLVPLKVGTLEIPAAAARVGVRGRSVFAPLEAVESSTGAVAVEVRPRPAPPAGFAGAVGRLTYSAELDPSAVELGTSALLTIRLEGTGNLPLVEDPPAWPSSPDCQLFPPEQLEELTVDERGIRGSRSWRATLVPRRPGRIELAPVTLAVFDPAAGAYREQVLGPLTLEVSAPTPTPTPTPPVAEEVVAEPSPSPSAGAAPGPAAAGWLPLVAALAAGVMVGGAAVWLVVRRRGAGIPPRREGTTPAERARELQAVLERWWLDRGRPAHLRERMEEIRRELEAVRFAPGRADHSDTVEDLEERLRRLLRGA